MHLLGRVAGILLLAVPGMMVSAADLGPGRPKPSASAPAGAWRIDWAGENQTWIVIAPGIGRVQPAWIATYEKDDHGYAYAVAYPALAWRDAAGAIHIGAKRARVVGPKAFNLDGTRRWYPDNFAIHPDGSVGAQDEQPEATINQGRVIELVDPAKDPAAWRTRRNEVVAQAENQC